MLGRNVNQCGRAIHRWSFRRPPCRAGFALLMCLFVIFMTTVWLGDMLGTQSVHMSAVRNVVEYEQALYQANAGVHHVAAELEADNNWRGTVTDGGYPASGSYSATATDGATEGTVEITSTGVAGQVSRSVQAAVQVN